MVLHHLSVILPVCQPPHQSVMSSAHLLAGLPRGRFPSTIPRITVFTSHSSLVLQMCANSFYILCFTVSHFVDTCPSTKFEAMRLRKTQSSGWNL